MPSTTVTITVADTNSISLHDGTSESDTKRLQVGFGILDGSYGNYFQYIPIPGNGILFNTGIFINFDPSDTDAATQGVLLVYQR